MPAKKQGRKLQKSIRFRCSEELYNFIQKLRKVGRSGANKRPTSNVIRHIINVFRIAWLKDKMDLKGMTEELKSELGSNED